uniref:Uncharacterized protein n=1 Tax=viral metagenome TaxID=1070528 RepID=A0A6M3L395_9ZZZZ
MNCSNHQFYLSDVKTINGRQYFVHSCWHCDQKRVTLIIKKDSNVQAQTR